MKVEGREESGAMRQLAEMGDPQWDNLYPTRVVPGRACQEAFRQEAVRSVKLTFEACVIKNPRKRSVATTKTVAS